MANEKETGGNKLTWLENAALNQMKLQEEEAEAGAAVKAEEERQANLPSKLESAARGLVDDVSFGFKDELEGAVQGGAKWLTKKKQAVIR